MNRPTDQRRRRYTLWHGLSAAAITLAAVICAALLLSGGRWATPSGTTLRLGILAALLSGVVGAWVARRRARMLIRLLDLTDAWLRGNLSLRAHDVVGDAFGGLPAQLDLLIGHLEEDEQDLERLRESNVLLTDQVRALALVEERNRLARELHDSIKQHLFSLAMTASAVKATVEAQQKGPVTVTPEIQEMIGEIERSAQTAQRETTRLIEDLRPAPLQERGLIAALNDYALLFGAQQHLLVYLDAECNDRWVPPLITEHLYRTVQEALHNVARHAHATRVDIQLTCSSRRIRLAVRDNGVGFDVGVTPKGLGIAGMQERLLAAGGRLAIQSRPGAGTEVIAEVDISATPDRQGPFVDDRSHGPHPEEWRWLGERLVIPVGQTWPWLPADQERYLREPRIGPGTLTLKRGRSLLGLREITTLHADRQSAYLARLRPDRTGHSWEIDRDSWALHQVRGLRGRAILERHGQTLAALQYRGRQMESWTEIVYDDSSYRLETHPEAPEGFVLRDNGDPPIMEIRASQVTLARSLPVPLIATVVARALYESAFRPEKGEL
jgi:two-component system, NarL family, sensor histidine kinase LiaS